MIEVGAKITLALDEGLEELSAKLQDTCVEGHPDYQPGVIAEGRDHRGYQSISGAQSLSGGGVLRKVRCQAGRGKQEHPYPDYVPGTIKRGTKSSEEVLFLLFHAPAKA